MTYLKLAFYPIIIMTFLSALRHSNNKYNVIVVADIPILYILQ